MSNEPKVICVEACKSSSGQAPFLETLRIACPFKGYSQRRTKHCIECKYFQGLQKIEITGDLNEADPTTASRLYRVICAHPIGRRITYLSDD